VPGVVDLAALQAGPHGRRKPIVVTRIRHRSNYGQPRSQHPSQGSQSGDRRGEGEHDRKQIIVMRPGQAHADKRDSCDSSQMPRPSVHFHSPEGSFALVEFTPIESGEASHFVLLMSASPRKRPNCCNAAERRYVPLD
jgi:hypothetical protein